MHYSNIDLGAVLIPSDEAIGKDTEWRFEKEPGIGCYVQNLSRPSITVATRKCRDTEAGMKYGIFFEFSADSPRMESIVAYLDKHDSAMPFYLQEQLLSSGFKADDPIYFCEDLNNCLVWTTIRDYYDKMRQEVSRAISEITSENTASEDLTVGLGCVETRKIRLYRFDTIV